MTLNNLTYLFRIFSIALMLLTLGCSSKYDNEVVAKRTAEAWVSSNIDTIAGKVVDLVAPEATSLAKPALAFAIKSALNWQYSANRIGADKWQVIVTGNNSLDLSKVYLNKIAKFEGAFRLIVDTSQMTVTDFNWNQNDFKATFTSTQGAGGSAPKPTGESRADNYPLLDDSDIFNRRSAGDMSIIKEELAKRGLQVDERALETSPNLVILLLGSPALQGDPRQQQLLSAISAMDEEKLRKLYKILKSESVAGGAVDQDSRTK